MRKPVARRISFYVILSLILVVVDSTLVKFLSLAGIVPDILVVWIVYIAIREGQIAGTTAGFFIGLVMNLMGMTESMLGLAALAKTVAGFTAGYFYNENKTYNTLGGYQFIVIVAVASFVHNVFYFIIFLQGSDLGWTRSVLAYGIPTTAYTAAIALLPMFAFARKYLS
ncbi:MAG TPA: rod shape-determining protein MreD [Bacteroidetes bacterium]|jgi:rod shape-determining protein MreD|nr:rod shape-determining protein MreD [Bacteroidota bacterium]